MMLKLLGVYSGMLVGLVLTAIIAAESEELRGRNVGIFTTLPLLAYIVITIIRL